MTTTVDAIPPVVDRFLINFGALQTTGITVSLSIGAPDATSGVVAMSFSNDGQDWSAWQPYAATAIWSLPAGDVAKIVHERFRDAAGNISMVVSDTIVLMGSSRSVYVQFRDYAGNVSQTYRASAQQPIYVPGIRR